VISTAMSLVVGYDLCMSIAQVIYELGIQLVCLADSSNDGLQLIASNFDFEFNWDAKTIWKEVLGNLVGIILLSFLVYNVQIFLFLRASKRDLQAIRKGTFVDMPKVAKAGLGTAVVFVGYQIAFSLIAGFMYALLFGLIFALGNLFRYFPNLFVLFLQEVLAAPLIFVVFFLLVQFFTDKLFTIKGSGLWIRYVRFFYHYDYVFIFLNIARGIFSLVTRILFWLMMLFYVYRVDCSPLVEELRFLDMGYNSYLGFLASCRHYSNPTALTFVDILTDNSLTGHSRPTDNKTEPLLASDGVKLANRKTKAKNHWFVCVTLIRNRQLVQFRKRNLGAHPSCLLLIQICTRFAFW